MKNIAVKKKVKLPGVEGVYEAWCYTGADATFNSFLCPHFKYEEAYRFMNAWNRAEDIGAWMFYVGNEFYLDGMSYPVIDIQTEDGLLSLYALGAHEWSWWDEAWTKAEGV